MAEHHRNLVTDQLAAEAVKSGGRLLKHARDYWLFAGREPSDAAAAWRHSFWGGSPLCLHRPVRQCVERDFDHDSGKQVHGCARTTVKNTGFL